MLLRPPRLVLLVQLLVMLAAIWPRVLQRLPHDSAKAKFGIVDAQCPESPDTAAAEGDDPIAATSMGTGPRSGVRLVHRPVPPPAGSACETELERRPRGPPLV